VDLLVDIPTSLVWMDIVVSTQVDCGSYLSNMMTELLAAGVWWQQRTNSLVRPWEPCKVLQWAYLYDCLSARISQKPHVQTSQGFFVRVNCGSGLLLLWRLCNTLCTSGFVDDVMFSDNGPNTDTGCIWPIILCPWCTIQRRRLTAQAAQLSCAPRGEVYYHRLSC